MTAKVMAIDDDSDASSKVSLDNSLSSMEDIPESDLIGLGALLGGENIGDGAPPPPPPQQPSPAPLPITAWGTGVVIPQYKPENRMLMRSPLPSPTQTVRKKVVAPHMTDDDSVQDDDRQKKREEEHVARLVHMAKAQQNLMTAWFAASAGAEEVTLPGPRRKSRRKSASKTASAPDQTAPIDLDSGDQWDPSKIPPDPEKVEEFHEESECYESGGYIYCCGNAWSKNKIVLVLLLAVFSVAFFTIYTTMVKGEDNTFNRSSEDDDLAINPPLMLNLPTNFPSISPSVPPSGSPSFPYPSNFPSDSFVPTTSSPSSQPTSMPTRSPSQLPSSRPSFRPSSIPSVTPSLKPSSLPSISPSTIPSLSPSSTPSSRPSNMPSITQMPSLIPSVSPSTIFSTTTFDTLIGGNMSGNQIEEQFGYGVAMNSAGTIIAIGAREFNLKEQEGVGRVIVYEENNDGTWTQKGQDLIGRNAGDQFGWAVSLSGNGQVLAVSEPSFDTDYGNRVGNVRVFSWNDIEQQWLLLGDEIPGEEPSNLFGFSLSLSNDGSRLAVGAPYQTPDFYRMSGRVRVFELIEGSWKQLGQPLDGSSSVDWFGWSVDFSDDGNSIAIGAPRNRQHGGYVRVFNLRTLNGEPTWVRTGRDINNEIGNANSQDRFGMSVSLDNNQVAIGSPWKDTNSFFNAGMVAIYELVDDDWKLKGSPIKGVDPLGQYGSSLCLRGDYLTVGSEYGRDGMGKVSFHRYDGNDWDTASSVMEGLTAKEDFGFVVLANQDSTRILVGAPAREHPDNLSGSIQVFSRKI